LPRRAAGPSTGCSASRWCARIPNALWVSECKDVKVKHPPFLEPLFQDSR
jgi:hypothetical protein